MSFRQACVALGGGAGLFLQYALPAARRLHDEPHAVTLQVIERLQRQDRRLRVIDVVAEIEQRCRELKIPPPHRRSIDRRIERFAPHLVERRGGNVERPSKGKPGHFTVHRPLMSFKSITPTATSWGRPNTRVTSGHLNRSLVCHWPLVRVQTSRKRALICRETHVFRQSDRGHRNANSDTPNNVRKTVSSWRMIRKP